MLSVEYRFPKHCQQNPGFLNSGKWMFKSVSGAVTSDAKWQCGVEVKHSPGVTVLEKNICGFGVMFGEAG